jgi:hypothetical protein
MPGDYSRTTFQRTKHYSGVLMQQGRVQLDADWNDQLAIQHHRTVVETVDIVGPCAAPTGASGFEIELTRDGRDLTVSPGRFYAGGLLCELEASPIPIEIAVASPTLAVASVLSVDGRPLEVGQWVAVTAVANPLPKLVRIAAIDPELRRLTLDLGIGEYAQAGGASIRRMTTYTTQPDLPNPPFASTLGSPPASPLTSPLSPLSGLSLADGVYVVALHAWQREITALDDRRIRETALGGPDTSARLKTVWQVELVPVTVTGGGTPTCATTFPEWDHYTATGSGLLNARAKPSDGDKGPCVLPPTAGYLRLENQLYRVVIHRGGPPGTATFKWSRENASVETTIEDVDAAKLTVASVGKDDVLGFAAGQWVEIADDESELKNLKDAGVPRPLVQIDHVEPETREITLKTSVAALAGRHGLKLRRWDQTVGAGADGVSTAGAWIDLEGGIQVTFPSGTYHAGDYWLIPARSATSEIEWPPFEVPNPDPIPQPPAGVRHYYCRLALLEVTDGTLDVIGDCRPLFPPLTELEAFFYVSGDGQEALPGQSVARPLQAGVANPQGGVPGARVRFHVLSGGGTLTVGASSGDDLVALTGPNGVAECNWQLGGGAQRTQQVEATLLDTARQPLHLPIRFNATQSLAAHVAYDPSKCAELKAAGATTVQAAIDELCRREGGAGCSVTVGKGGQFESLDEAIVKLLNQRQPDICICLMPGAHTLKNGLTVKPELKNTHLAIAGCAGGTRLIIQGASLRFVSFAGLTLRDLDISAEKVNDPIVVEDCDDVAILGCRVSQTTFPTDLLTIAGATSIRVRDSVLESSTDVEVPFPLTAKTRAARARQLTERLNADRESLLRFSEFLAGPVAAGEGLTAERRESLKDQASLLRQLAGATDGSAARLAAIGDAVGAVMFATALVLADGKADTSITDNRFDGALRLYGRSFQMPTVAVEALGKAVQGSKPLLTEPGGGLTVHGNRLTSVWIDRDVTKQLDGQGNLPGLYDRVAFSDNLVTDPTSVLLGHHLIVTGTRFEVPESSPVAGTGIGRSAVVVANSASRINADLRRVFRVAVPKNGGDVAPGVGTNLCDVQPL